MEARRFLLAVGRRRSPPSGAPTSRPSELRALARVAAREQTADFTFFAGLVEASGTSSSP